MGLEMNGLACLACNVYRVWAGGGSAYEPSQSDQHQQCSIAVLPKLYCPRNSLRSKPTDPIS